MTLEIDHIYNMDCLQGLRQLPPESVDCCVTSPPYWGLRDYGVDGQLGLEKTPEEYVSKLVAIFREVHRVLKKDGTVWLNLGDSYTSNGISGPQSDHSGNKRITRGHQAYGKASSGIVRIVPQGLKPKDLVGIPWRVAFALQADGWWLRQDIIWAKPNPMPESVTDRCTKAHEYIFLLTKDSEYFYDQEAIKQPVAESTIGRGPVDFGGEKGRSYKQSIEPSDPNYRNGKEQWGRTFDYTVSCKNGCNKRSVWTVTTKPFSEAHFATFPEDLIEPCIKTTRPEAVILDPFMGAGTTALVARKLLRHYIGFEVNPDYCKIARKRLLKVPQRLELFEVN